MGREVITDADTRATNFPASLAGRLFGTSGERHRCSLLHYPARPPLECRGTACLPAQTTLRHAELLVSAPDSQTQDSERPGILALHLSATVDCFADAMTVANNLARQRGGRGGSQLHGALAYERLRTLHTSICRGLVFPTEVAVGAETESTIYSMILIDQKPTGNGPTLTTLGPYVHSPPRPSHRRLPPYGPQRVSSARSSIGENVAPRLCLAFITSVGPDPKVLRVIPCSIAGRRHRTPCGASSGHPTIARRTGGI